MEENTDISTEDNFQPDELLELWQNFISDEENRKELELYIAEKESSKETPPTHAVIAYLDTTVFDSVTKALRQMLLVAKKRNALHDRKMVFNGIDYLAECIWNMNPLHADRKRNWTYIFDMDWVKKQLLKEPRPFYPNYLFYDKDTAATKIQAYIRGYLTRKHLKEGPKKKSPKKKSPSRKKSPR